MRASPAFPPACLQPGTVGRHFWLANDKCSAEGPEWRPRRVVLLPSLHDGPPPAAVQGRGAAPPRGTLHVDTAPAPEEDGAAASTEEEDAGIAAAAAAGAERSGLAPPRSGAAVMSLVGLPSRGSRLPARRRRLTSAGEESSGGGGGEGWPEVVTDDPCLWAHYRGQWGGIEAPVTQAWMREAEPPLSRTPLLRLFGHKVKSRHTV